MKRLRVPIPPRILGVLLTYRCTATCDHCCFSCSPLRSESIDERVLFEVLEEASSISSIDAIVFSGGEPFMLYDLLIRAISHAKKLAFKTKVVTNGFWAVSCSQADKLLAGLKHAGLDVLELTADHFHQQHVPLACVKNALQAAVNLGIRAKLVEIRSRTTPRLRDFKMDQWKHLINDVQHVELPVLPIGRAAERLPIAEFVPECMPMNTRCNALEMPAIDPNGDVYLCCSVSGFHESLKLGNKTSESLPVILDSASWNPLCTSLSYFGPRHLAHNVLSLPALDRQFVDICHLCNWLLLNHSKTLAEWLGQHEAELHILKAIVDNADFRDCGMPGKLGLVAN